jgi:signal peptidase
MKKAVRIVVNVLAWLVLILAFLITLIVFSSGKNNGVANLMGYIPLTVESDSMKPTFSKDDLILCKEVDDINALKENDVITFWTVIDGKRVKNTHRIVGINESDSARSFVTRGDANSIDDTLPAYSSDIIGKWTNVKIAGLGKFMSFLRTKKGFFIFIIIPIAVFFLIELYKFIVTLIELKRPEAITELDEEEIKRRAVEEYLASQKEAEDAKKKAESAENKAEEKVEDVKEKAEEAVEAAENKVEEKVEDVKEKAEEAVEAVENKAEEKAEDVKEKAEEAVEAVENKAEEKVEDVKEKAEEAAEAAENKAEEIAEDVKEKAEEAAEEITEAAEEKAKETAETAE